MSALAAFARFGSSVSILISASFRSTQSTLEIASTSESRAVSIHRFIESSAANRAAAHCERTSAEDRAGCFRGRASRRARDASESFGAKSANTPSCVSSV